MIGPDRMIRYLKHESQGIRYHVLVLLPRFIMIQAAKECHHLSTSCTIAVLG